MLGLMQNRPLLISGLIDYAERFHGQVEIVSRSIEGPLHRTTWAGVARRSRRLAGALRRLGVGPGDRVATLAWNTWRHLELYYAATGMGAVLHTVNPRLFADQIQYILGHAEDKLVFFDTGFAPLLAQLLPRLPQVRGTVALCARDAMPAADLPGLFCPGPLCPGPLCYEDLLDAEGDEFAWPSFDENTASSLCYTSGTTGNPKGVLYSHRSQVLHSFCAQAADTVAASARDSILLIVPMFHANAWGLPFAAAGVGAKLVLPGMNMDGENLLSLMLDEGATLAAGIPTIWLNLVAWLEQNPGRLDRAKLRLNRIISGGSAPPPALIESLHRLLGATMVQAWGMTETSPIATAGTLLPQHEGLDLAGRIDIQRRQGRAIFGCELRIVDDAGNELPRDGESVGEIQVRGPWVIAGYFKGAGGRVLDDDGWFRTGDVASMDAEGWVRISDRAKDIIKSGGEWISSIAIENLTVSHPCVYEAAVIAAAHPIWQERPLLLVRLKDDAEATKQDILDFLAPRIAKWWLPDDVVFVDALPHTATGKLLKTKLRQEYGDWLIRPGKA